MRTGKRLGLGPPELRNEARRGNLSGSGHVLLLLADLNEIAGLPVPAEVAKWTQQSAVADDKSSTP
jgi:hypothetical protein